MSVITPAASVLLARGPGSREIFAILRSRQLKFFGGFWAFPGGKLTNVEATTGTASDMCRFAACRELFEETGILIARTSDGAFPHITDDLAECRQHLLHEEISFDTILNERGLAIRACDFQRIGEITTPAFAPLRFATTFFVAHLPPEQEPSVWPGELEHGEWIDVGELLARWRRGDVLLTPPSAMSLEHLGLHPVDDAPTRLGPLFEHLALGAEHPIFLAPCVRMLPLRTNGLPPSTHTNAYLVGAGPRYLIDPGPEDADEQARLFALVDEEVSAGRPLDAIILTHHHPDHIGAANVCAERYRVPIWAHPATAKHLQGRIAISRFLDDGAQINLGAFPADGRPWFLQAMHTPGHASGHLVFFEPLYRLLFAGDMLSTLTSMVIAPPDGDLTQYLDSLCRLRSLPTRLVLFAHGNVSAQPTEVIDDALAHRARREAQLLDALVEGPIAIPDLTARLYRGLAEALMRFAQAQVLAGLLKLQNEGRAIQIGEDRWRLC